MQTSSCLAIVLLALLLASGRLPASGDTQGFPLTTDRRLTIELFCEHPRIMTPTGIAVDDQGRVFVAESHTHFRPKDYNGPPTDRILIFEDPDRDGHAEKRTVFHQGFTHVMDIEWHRDGSLYVATRRDIHRLRDTDGDERADEVTLIVRLDTKGTYPHNGLSGLAFDFTGHLHFGLGENLGEAYTLVGTDGRQLTGGGEGGSTYQTYTDGSRLRRVSTGWWNPFGMCVDAFGRVFGTDNDPGDSPPCRLIQVVEDGDYGYEYRYGRTGLHPLVTWTGDTPGTLPMVAGTGEAPCAVVAYESDALPEEYRGDLLVASWSDRRIEHYPIHQRKDSGLVETSRQVLFESDDSRKGNADFRPVGLAVAPDGSVLVSDWASDSYELNQRGRIWRIRPQAFPPREAPADDPRRALLEPDRRIREGAARQLSSSASGRTYLRTTLSKSREARTRAAALKALVTIRDPDTDYAAIARRDPEIALQVLAARHLLSGARDPTPWVSDDLPSAVRAEAVLHLDIERHGRELTEALQSRDPLLFHAGIGALAKQTTRPAFETFVSANPLGALLAMRRARRAGATTPIRRLERFLAVEDPRVRYAAVKWIADDKLARYRPALEDLMRREDIDFRLFLATTAALDRLDGKEPTDRPTPARLLERIVADETPTEIRRLSLRLIDPTFPELKVTHLARLLDHKEAGIRLEAIRTLARHPGAASDRLLGAVADDGERASDERSAAVAGLRLVSEPQTDRLVKLACDEDRAVGQEALRSLVALELTPEQARALRDLARANPGERPAVQRVLDGSPGSRPPPEDTDAWLKLLTQKGDPVRGERVFFGSKVGLCSRCHQVDGRGGAVGPDLTHISRRLVTTRKDPRRWLLETILEPSRDMSPEYTPWMILMKDGRTLVGLPRTKGHGMATYFGVDGKQFSVRQEEMEFQREVAESIMPGDLLQMLTPGEVRDLFAYLQQKG